MISGTEMGGIVDLTGVTRITGSLYIASTPDALASATCLVRVDGDVYVTRESSYQDPTDLRGLEQLASVGGSQNANKTAVAKGGALTIPADPSGALSFLFGKAIAKPGPVTISMPNQSPIQHNISIQGPVNGKGPIIGHGATSSFQVTLKPGTYTFLCDVPGHAAAGMKGTLTVK